MWASLGDLQFKLLDSPGSMGRKREAEYAEHGHIEGKPTLQWTQDKLEAVNLELHLFRHERLLDPGARIQALEQALAAHQALPLVFGDGRYPGRYVLTSLDIQTRETGDDGTTVEAVVKVSLKEWIGGSGATGEAGIDHGVQYRVAGGVPPAGAPEDQPDSAVLRR